MWDTAVLEGSIRPLEHKYSQKGIPQWLLYSAKGLSPFLEVRKLGAGDTGPYSLKGSLEVFQLDMPDLQRRGL